MFVIYILAACGVGALIDVLSPFDGRMGVQLAAWKRAVMAKVRARLP